MMKQFFTASGVLTFLLLLSGFTFYGNPNLPTFTPTGYATISGTTSSASAVLGSSAASSPMATTAVITNLGPNVAFVKLGASNVVATVTGGYPVAVSSVAALTLGSATYAAAITQTGTATVSVVTGY